MTERTKAYLLLHSAVLLFGLTGILGKVIDLPEPTMVWYRMGLTVFSLMLFPGIFRHLLSLPRSTYLSLTFIGVIVAFHWILFFTAIELTNVSVTLACLASSTLFTSMLEPIILKGKAKWYQVILGIAVIPGVWLIYRNAEDNGQLGLGIICALLSAFLASVFGVLNKKMVEHYDPVSITFVELGTGWLVVCLLLPFWYMTHPADIFIPVPMDWLWLSILAFLCTTYAFIATLKALKVLSPFSVALSINLEPVYSIILAIALLAEHKQLDAGFYLGAGIILLSVFAHPFIEKWMGRSGFESKV